MAALVYGVTPLLIRLAVIGGDLGTGVAAGLVSYVAATATIALLLLWPGQLRHALAVTPESRKWFTYSGVSVSIAQMFIYMAYAVAPISVVTPILQLHLVLRLVFSRVLNPHHEIFGGRMVLGTALSVLGAVALSLDVEHVLRAGAAAAVDRRVRALALAAIAERGEAEIDPALVSDSEVRIIGRHDVLRTCRSRAHQQLIDQVGFDSNRSSARGELMPSNRHTRAHSGSAASALDSLPTKMPRGRVHNGEGAIVTVVDCDRELLNDVEMEMDARRLLPVCVVPIALVLVAGVARAPDPKQQASGRRRPSEPALELPADEPLDLSTPEPDELKGIKPLVDAAAGVAGDSKVGIDYHKPSIPADRLPARTAHRRRSSRTSRPGWRGRKSPRPDFGLPLGWDQTAIETPRRSRAGAGPARHHAEPLRAGRRGRDR